MLADIADLLLWFSMIRCNFLLAI